MPSLHASKLAAGLDLDQPQDDVAEAFARSAHGGEAVDTTARSSQTATSPSRSNPTLPSVRTTASKATLVMLMRTTRLL
jgi:hypothetical protein